MPPPAMALATGLGSSLLLRVAAAPLPSASGAGASSSAAAAVTAPGIMLPVVLGCSGPAAAATCLAALQPSWKAAPGAQQTSSDW
jgi:hypothetical protein